MNITKPIMRRRAATTCSTWRDSPVSIAIRHVPATTVMGYMYKDVLNTMVRQQMSKYIPAKNILALLALSTHSNTLMTSFGVMGRTVPSYLPSSTSATLLPSSDT